MRLYLFGFQKLLIDRTAVRMFVFDGRHCRNGEEALANKLCDWFGAFEGSRKGDTYLLVAYEEEKTSWRFRYFNMLVDDSGQQSARINISQIERVKCLVWI